MESTVQGGSTGHAEASKVACFYSFKKIKSKSDLGLYFILLFFFLLSFSFPVTASLATTKQRCSGTTRVPSTGAVLFIIFFFFVISFSFFLGGLVD